MDPLLPLAGYEGVLGHLSSFFTSDEACRAARTSRQWRNWMTNAEQFWKWILIEQEWPLPPETDPFLLYMKHKRMIFDVKRANSSVPMLELYKTCVSRPHGNTKYDIRPQGQTPDKHDDMDTGPQRYHQQGQHNRGIPSPQ